MLFTSLEFIFLFLPIVIAINFILPKKLRNLWLLVASLIFYAWGEPRFVFVMIGSIIVNYVLALAIAYSKDEAFRKTMLTVAVIANISVLFIFKYLNFTISNIHALLPFTKAFIPQTAIVLPIGISFFTFQAMSYVIDVYRGEAVQVNPINIGLYISLFPQLIAGPIVRYKTVNEEINDRNVTSGDFSEGTIRFLVGFIKKVMLANVLSIASDASFEMTDLSVGMAWLGSVARGLQVFYDFSAYSDMAIGLGLMLGFHFLENFDYPYIAGTITEFWRRWHISLGSWFRDYVYYPLGGSRVKNKLYLVRNLAVIWVLTGIWHGPNWTYFIWGIIWGIFAIFEKLFEIPKRLEKSNFIFRLIYRIFTLLVILIQGVLINCKDMGQFFSYVGAMFGIGASSVIDDAFLFNLYEYRYYLIAGLICCFPVFRAIREFAFEEDGPAGALIRVIFNTGVLALFVISISYLVINAHNPFIYFNF
ncbi:MAG: MBOAT family O-acyltransferase [Eubacteriales bacterium]|nr:MBOAT family O-acyltransferase [Eubacteriales bacterium]